MLKNLTIRNYALIRRLEMEPSSNLNIITGETGAGKSIMIGAVGLLLGNRADTRVLYDENEKCVIEGVFDIEEYGLRDLFNQNELDYERQTIIRREISPAGKSRAFVNDTPVTLDVLRELGGRLMDVHSQHDTLQLASNDYQLSIIDSYAGHHNLLESYRQHFQEFKKADKAYRDMLKEAEAIREESAYNQFLLEELTKANFTEDEQEELETHLQLLEHGEEIKLKLSQILNLLDQSEFAVNVGLHEANLLMARLGEYSEKYRNLGERLNSCLIELKDIADETDRESAQVEFDPEKIEQTKERLSLLYQLQQKHRVSDVKALLQIQADLQRKVEKAVNLDDELITLKTEAGKKEEMMRQNAEKLSLSRKKAFESFSTGIEGLVKNLGMPNATLSVDHTIIPPGESGIDSIKLLFSANKGISPQELKMVASGGEFSRLMFCIKYILADKTALPTIVFDEIDTGISGEIALKMVRMMEQLAQKRQALVITHLPQIASRGDMHYYVYKDESTDKTVSMIRPLSVGERVQEIAKMIGGDKPSSVALENARELLGID